MKPVRKLSEHQKKLLLEVWVTAHKAIDKSRQPFTYQVLDEDKPEWDDLIENGYLESIPDEENRFILTSYTDDIFDDLVTYSTKTICSRRSMCVDIGRSKNQNDTKVSERSQNGLQET